jgi:hypothetical protein
LLHETVPREKWKEERYMIVLDKEKKVKGGGMLGERPRLDVRRKSKKVCRGEMEKAIYSRIGKN